MDLGEKYADDGAEEDPDGEVHDVSELRRDERYQHEREGYREQPLIHAQRPSNDLDGTVHRRETTGVRMRRLHEVVYFKAGRMHLHSAS